MFLLEKMVTPKVFQKVESISMRKWFNVTFVLLTSAMMLISPHAHADSSEEHRQSSGPNGLDAARDLNIRGWLRMSRHNPEVVNIYLEISNSGKEAFLITGIRSAACPTIYGVNFDQDDTEQAAEMFTHFTIPHKMTLVFPRGGYHLICRGFQPEGKSPHQMTLDFNFLSGGHKRVILDMDEKGF